MSFSLAKNPGIRAKLNLQEEKVFGQMWGSLFAWNLVRKALLILKHQHHSPLNLEDGSEGGHISQLLRKRDTCPQLLSWLSVKQHLGPGVVGPSFVLSSPLPPPQYSRTNLKLGGRAPPTNNLPRLPNGLGQNRLLGWSEQYTVPT